MEASGGNADEKMLGMLDESKGEFLTFLLLFSGSVLKELKQLIWCYN